MANELTYQSVFTGQEMDERFTAVAQLQAALLEVETALSAKYVKPASGIPETDLDSAVQSALAKARSAVQDLSNYYTKTEIDSLLAAVNSQEYVDVATLPTASASTLGKIYLVGPTNNQYDRYYTSYDGSAYSWVAAGSTEINLSNYATKAELNQLGQEMGEVDVTFTADKSVSLGGTIGATLTLDQEDESGWNSAIVTCQKGDQFTVSGTGGSSTRLWGFVDADNVLLSVAPASLTASGLVLVAPERAAKAVFNTHGSGSVSYLSIESHEYRIEELGDKIGDLDNLDTTTTTDLVSAINEVYGNISDNTRLINTKINESLFDGSSIGFESGGIDEYGEPTDSSTSTTTARSQFVDKRSGIFWIDTDRTLRDVGAALYKEGTYVGRVENIRMVSTPGVSQGLFRFEIITSLEYDQFRVFASGSGLTDSSLSNTFVIQESFAEHIYGPKVNLDDIGTKELYAMYHELVRRYPNYISERVLGYDSSGQYEVYEYVATLRDQFAYIHKEAAYAWINDDDVIYTASISPVLGDMTYSDQFDTETGNTVTAVTSSAITVNGLSYTRDADDDIAADVIYRTTGTSPSVTQGGKTYSRAKNLDRSSFGEKTIMTICNEHGPNYDPREPSFVMYQILRALCEENGTSPELGWLKKYACLVVIPVVNPYAYNRVGSNDAAGRVNYDGVNITRNYPTEDWDTLTELEPGPYPGSEVETQYVMNSIKRNNIDICINEHCLGGTDKLWEYQGDIVSLVDDETKAMMSVYGLSFYSLGTGDPGNVDVWCREQGITGVILEMNTGKGIAGEYHSSYMLEADKEIWMNVLRLYGYFPASSEGSPITVDSALSPSSTNPVQNAVIHAALSDKQNTLVSGTNIKTINGEPILGSGDITISGDGSITIDSELSTSSTNPVQNAVITTAVNAKQNTLVSGTTIKTVNGNSILGSGDLEISAENAVQYVEQTLTDGQKTQARTNIGAAASSEIPTATSDLENDSGFLTSAVTSFNGNTGAVTYIAPVTSVNGDTGAVTGLEETTNKVTSLSSNSTDNEYPSAKCVYDLIGDIETTLATIIGD